MSSARWVRALRADNRKSLEALIAAHGVDDTINTRDCTESSPLWFALTDHNVSLACWLIERGADVNFVSGDGDAPLHVAAGDDTLQPAAALLIARGADLETRSRYGSGDTALERAIVNGAVRNVLLLVRSDADRARALLLAKKTLARRSSLNKPALREIVALLKEALAVKRLRA